MRRFSTLLVGLALVAAIAVLPGRALAATPASVTLPVQASVTSGCLFAAVGINFGAVSPLIVEEDITVSSQLPQAQGTIFLACGTFGPTSGTLIDITLDNGANGLAAAIVGIGTKATAIRAMTNGTSFLAYDLFQPTTFGITLGTIVGPTVAAATAAEWGNGQCSILGLPNLQGANSLCLTPGQYNACVTGANSGAAACAIEVFGAIPGDQVQPLTPGIYTDTVAATITF